MNEDKEYKCEICGTEISQELAHFTMELCDSHRLCHKHKRLYFEARRSVRIQWDGEKFVAILIPNPYLTEKTDAKI